MSAKSIPTLGFNAGFINRVVTFGFGRSRANPNRVISVSQMSESRSIGRVARTVNVTKIERSK